MTGAAADGAGPPGPSVADDVAAAPPDQTPRQMAEVLAAALRGAGTELVFGLPGGGTNLDIIGAVEAAGLRFVLAHSEGGAMLMAAVAAELTGRPGACVVTRGPGAASAVNGAAHALLDRQPLLLVTDCVTDADRARVSHQRLDHGRLFGAVTKASLVYGPADPAATAETALRLAVEGRPGPVHLDFDPTATDPPPAPAPSPPRSSRLDLTALRQALRAARRPVIVAGIGAVGAAKALRGFVDGTAVPVLTTYKARGVVSDRSPHAAGLATGATIEAPVLAAADLIVGVGLDPVELIPAPWPYRAPVVLLGSWPTDDSTFFGDRLMADVVGDLGQLLADVALDLTSTWPSTGAGQARTATLERLRAAVPATDEGVLPQDVVTIARSVAPAGTIATVDAGAHMLVAVPLWEVDGPGELLISSGLATMGFALPAAIAAALVHPERRVICFIGDGGLGMTLAELETLARLCLDVVVVVFDDRTLSLIAVKQRADGHGGERAIRYAPTDFAQVAAGFDVAASRAEDRAGYREAMVAALHRPGPSLVDVTVDPRGYGAVIDAIRGSAGGQVTD